MTVFSKHNALEVKTYTKVSIPCYLYCVLDKAIVKKTRQLLALCGEAVEVAEGVAWGKSSRTTALS